MLVMLLCIFCWYLLIPHTGKYYVICQPFTIAQKKEEKKAAIQPQLFAVIVVMSQLVSLFVDETTYEASLSHSQRYKGTVHVYVCWSKKGAWGMVFRVYARISLKMSSNFCCCYFFRSHLQYVGQIYIFFVCFFFYWFPTKALNEMRIEWTADAEDRFEPGWVQTGWTHSLDAE